jgi:hypothetical protein
VWSILSVMVTRHRALAHLAKHLKILIRLSCRVTESLRILGFLSDQAELSAHWSRGAWTDYLSMQSYEILRFWTLIESCVPPSLLPTKCLDCKMLQSSNPACEVFHNWGADVVVQVETNTTEIIFHCRKNIWVHNAAAWLKYCAHVPMQ